MNKYSTENGTEPNGAISPVPSRSEIHRRKSILDNLKDLEGAQKGETAEERKQQYLKEKEILQRALKIAEEDYLRDQEENLEVKANGKIIGMKNSRLKEDNEGMTVGVRRSEMEFDDKKMKEKILDMEINDLMKEIERIDNE